MSYVMDPATQRKWQAHCRNLGAAETVDVAPQTVTIVSVGGGYIIRLVNGQLVQPNWSSNAGFNNSNQAALYARSQGYRVEEA